jgi:23S rRNA (cytosine1962-C5)-methyltransferase
LRGHPWIFSGSIANITGSEAERQPGQTVKVVDSTDKFLAWGALSPESNIRVRVWSQVEDSIISPEFLLRRISKAVKSRDNYFHAEQFNAYRLVHGESDGLPGLIVDKYAKSLVVQFLACGVEYWRETIVKQLAGLLYCEQIYERSDADVRRLEGLEPRKGLLMGRKMNPIEIKEGDRDYFVDVIQGQKTGFFLDQRENRAVIQDLAGHKVVLDCFAYTGGFSVAAMKGGAQHVTALDASSRALQMGEKNLQLNNIPGKHVEMIEVDVFSQLRKFRDAGRTFDMIILDPPKFAPTAAHAQKAARGYKDINLLAFKLLNPGGLLATFSCSGGVSAELFQKIVAGAALDAEVDAKIIRKLGPGVDHPVALNFPEGAYLKGFIIQV